MILLALISMKMGRPSIMSELENFKKAGELLSEISSEITIDLYQPSVKWVNPSVNPLKTGGNKKVTHT